MKSWRASPFYCSFCLAFFLSANCFGAGSEIKSVSLDHRLSKQTSLKSSVDSFVPPESKDSQLSGFDLTDPKSVAAYCETLARGKVHAPALQAVCEFALSLRWKLPNVIGEEERNRYQEGQLGGEEEK